MTPLQQESDVDVEDSMTNMLEAIRVQSHVTYDKVLITLSSGGLVATMVAMSELYKSQKVTHEWMIYAVIATLGISILITMWSFLMAACAAEQRMITPTGERQDLNTRKIDLSKAIKRLNIVSGVFSCLGILLLGIFISTNFHNAQSQITP